MTIGVDSFSLDIDSSELLILGNDSRGLSDSSDEEIPDGTVTFPYFNF